MSLPGADSATPKPTRVAGKKIWGVYVAGATYHVWTHQEVAGLKAGGIEGVLPIVVPTQTESWWLDNAGYAELELLVRQAKAWGVPKGSPLVLDIEEHQSAKMNAPGDVAHAWAVACNAHGLIPWAYGSGTFLVNDHYNNRWLAQWPYVTPVDPHPPTGYRGWQYHGNDNGIDHDVFLAGETFLSPELKPVTIDEHGPVKPVAAVAGDLASTPSGVGGRDVANTAVTDMTPPAPWLPTTLATYEVSPTRLQVSFVDSVDSRVVSSDGVRSSPVEAKAGTMAAVPLNLPTKSQVAVFVAEAGTLLVFVNDFVKFDKLHGWPLAGLNAAAAIVTAVSHWNNKRTAAAQAKVPVAPLAPGPTVTPGA